MILFLKATYYEIVKIFNRWRTYIGFATVILLVPIIMYLTHRFGFDVQDQALRAMDSSIVMVGSLVNGLLVSYYLMHVLWIHFPFFIVLVAGDIMAGEGAAGTFRILLTRPISRFQVVTAKFCATFFYTLVIVLFMGGISVGVGLLIVGGGDLFVVDKGILILSQSEALYRFLIAYSVAVIVQMVVAAMTFFFSTITSNGIGPIIGTYAIIVVSYILSVLQIDALEVVRPYLFTTYFDVFFAPFSDPIPWGEILQKVGYLCCYIFGFYIISTMVFLRRDITT
jgi:ABC-2 type transport system permease protein